jgi:hypothetical protein
MFIFPTLFAFIRFWFAFIFKADMFVVAVFASYATCVFALLALTAYLYDARQLAEALVIMPAALSLGSRATAHATVSLSKTDHSILAHL